MRRKKRNSEEPSPLTIGDLDFTWLAKELYLRGDIFHQLSELENRAGGAALWTVYNVLVTVLGCSWGSDNYCPPHIQSHSPISFQCITVGYFNANIPMKAIKMCKQNTVQTVLG